MKLLFSHLKNFNRSLLIKQWKIFGGLFQTKQHSHCMGRLIAIIAATALIHNLTLITRNIADFKSISNLAIINPHSL